MLEVSAIELAQIAKISIGRVALARRLSWLWQQTICSPVIKRACILAGDLFHRLISNNLDEVGHGAPLGFFPPRFFVR